MNTETIYNSADRVWDVITTMLEADDDRREDRATIAKAFNGDPPFTDDEVEEHNIETNVNFLEGTTLMHDARNQYRNAMLKPGDFFKLTVDGYLDVRERLAASKCITSKINRVMKRALPYSHTLRSQFASTALHGIGPAFWPGADGWRPEGIGLDDVLIPDETLLDMSDLQHFAIRREYSLFRFWKMSESRTPGWNKKATRTIIGKMVSDIEKGVTDNNDSYDFYRNPERVAEKIKQNIGYYNTSAVPKVKLWHFFTRDPDDKEGGWLRYIIEDRDNPDQKTSDFVFRSSKRYASDHSEIVHFQFGNLANVAPFRYHSLRSLGFLLYSVFQKQNELRCRGMDAAFADLLWFFRVQDVTDRDRIQRVDLHHLGVIPEGINIVGREERHQPDIDMLMFQLGQNRALMSESASSFRGDRDVGDPTAGKGMSATEVQARMAAVQQMVSAILGEAYDYATTQYYEIARRFSRKMSQDADIKKFHKQLKVEGVPDKYIDYERWHIEPVRTLGQGNKLMEAVQSQMLMAIRPLLDPDKQRRVVNLYVEANTDDAGLANELAPVDEAQFPSDSVIEAQQNAGVLLQGLPVGIPQGVNRGEYIASALQSLAVAVEKINKRGEVPKDVDELIGLQNLSGHIKQNIEIFAGDTSQKEMIGTLNNELSRLDNQIRAFAQRFEEQAQAQAKAQQQGNGAVTADDIAQIEKDRAMTDMKMRNREAASQQRLQQNEARFAQEQRIEQQRANQELANEQMKAAAKAQAE